MNLLFAKSRDMRMIFFHVSRNLVCCWPLVFLQVFDSNCVAIFIFNDMDLNAEYD